MQTPTTNQPRPVSTGPRRALAIAAIASVALWYVPGAAIVLYPLRIFITLVHEGGHAFMTILTGGGVDSITLAPSGSGLTWSRGGMPFFVLQAGYLFTAVAGATCLLVSRRPGAGRRALLALSLATLAVTFLWVHPWLVPYGPFGFAMGLLLGVLLALGARFLPPVPADLVLAFLAIQLSLNALSDVRDLIWLTTNTNRPNDAVLMAQTFGIVPWFWAGLWAVGAAVILAGALRAYFRAK